jgi:predicted nucleotide-binding protein (sugar kinase/HSP70/actin superfamily)
MEIFGIDVFGFFTNPVGALSTAATGLLVFEAYKFLNSVLKPVQYVEKLYEIADKIIEQTDDNYIDKIRNKRIKDDIQKELKEVLLKRKTKIDLLVKRISD